MSKKKHGQRSRASVTDKHGNTWVGVAPASQRDVEAAEAALGLTLPAELAELMMTLGAGRPTRSYYFSRANDIEIELGYVIPLVAQPKIGDLVKECEIHRRVHGLAPELIPFALDSGHANLICLRLPATDVVYWLHDEPEGRVRPVAPSLAALLEGLTEPPY